MNCTSADTHQDRTRPRGPRRAPHRPAPPLQREAAPARRVPRGGGRRRLRGLHGNPSGSAVESAYLNRETAEFTWAVSAEGDADEFRRLEQVWMAAPKRTAVFEGIDGWNDAAVIALVERSPRTLPSRSRRRPPSAAVSPRVRGEQDRDRVGDRVGPPRRPHAAVPAVVPACRPSGRSASFTPMPRPQPSPPPCSPWRAVRIDGSAVRRLARTRAGPRPSTPGRRRRRGTRAGSPTARRARRRPRAPAAADRTSQPVGRYVKGGVGHAQRVEQPLGEAASGSERPAARATSTPSTCAPVL